MLVGRETVGTPLLETRVWNDGLERGLNILGVQKWDYPGAPRCVGARARGIARVTGGVCLGAEGVVSVALHGDVLGGELPVLWV